MAAAADSPTNAHEYSVSEISIALKRTVEDQFGHVRVRGEISGYRGPHSSGHAYFALKDDRARLEAVVWKTTFAKLRFRPEEGMEIIATGKLTTYPGTSKYQIVIEQMEPAGAGALMALLEERKRRLGAEGLFDGGRKQLLPFLPRVIGVVTSPTGAVIRDIIHRIADRFPLRVVVWPVRVQGDTCGAEVAAAIAGFNALPLDGPVPRPDVLIVARGGGSLEDLWGFNDEAVVRATAASDIPVISAVGHETDWTLIDHAADVRAPTPTGAAEMAVPVKADLEARLASLGARLRACSSRGMDRRRHALRAAARALPSPDQLLGLPRRRLDEATGRLGRSLQATAERKRARLSTARLSPVVLVRRFTIARRDLSRLAGQIDKCSGAYLHRRRERLARGAARMTIGPLARRNAAGRRTLEALGVRLPRCGQAALSRSGDRFRTVEARRSRAWAGRLERIGARLTHAVRLFDSLSVKAVLDRGFALVSINGELARRASEIAPGAGLTITFADGEVEAAAAGRGGKKDLPRKSSPIAQGSLF